MANPENLIPHRVKPGEVRNPSGINQYTYRIEAEKHLEEWCVEYGREMVRVIADAARAGKPWAAKLILDRVLPAVTKHEIEDVTGTTLEALETRLASIAQRKRANGGNLGADGSGEGDADEGEL